VRIATLTAEPIDESVARRITGAGSQQLDGIGDVAAELMEDAQIRLLLINGTPSALETACQRAAARLEHVDQAKRPRARLHAMLQFALCLGEAGNSDYGHRVLSWPLKTCAALDLSQVLLDEGPRMLRLVNDAVDAKEFSSADPTTAANVRDFVSNLVEKSSV
jgi:hypothetical protein